MTQMAGIALNEFYGARDQLRAYQARFLPHLSARGLGLPILDLGCGSGVLLELLRERGRKGMGVDVAAEAVAECQARGLDVVQGDALDFLQDKRGCYSAIFCSHLIEHFPYEEACELLTLIRSALDPGGKLVLLTPNPASLEVISEIFWLDPTHVRPYPLRLLTRMVARAGLQVRSAGNCSPPGLPRREAPRRWLLRLLLGHHAGLLDTFLVAQAPVSLEREAL